MKRFGLGGPPPAAAGSSDPPTKESQQQHDILIDDSEAGRHGSGSNNNNHNDPGATLLLFKNDTDDSDKRFLLPPTLLLFFKACLAVFALTLLYITSTSILSSMSSSSSPAPLVLSPAVADACADKWRPDVLVGKCFGLEEAKDPAASKSPEACRAQCCGDEKCVTWQYQQTRGCFVGGPIRLGLERADTPHWCEESAQAPWTGRRLLSRTAGEGEGGKGEGTAPTCSFSTTEELIYQCFGLGPERVDAQGERLTSAAACQQYCCGDNDCKTWQFRQDKGCFAGSEGHCEEDNEPYIGGRKCVEGFC